MVAVASSFSDKNSTNTVPLRGSYLPPHDAEAEDSVIGGVLLQGSLLDLLDLSPEMFYASPNREVYQAFLELRETGTLIDVNSVAEWTRRTGSLDRVGGKSRLISLMDRVVSNAGILSCAKIVSDCYTRREFVAFGQKLSGMSLQEADVGKVIEFAESSVFQVRSRKAGFCQPMEGVGKTLTFLEEEAAGLNTVSTGFLDLDKLLDGGLRRGQLTVVAGDTSMGKSAFAQQVSMQVALQDKGVGIFTLEMSQEAYRARMMQSQLHRFCGQSYPKDWEFAVAALTEQGTLPILVNDASDLTCSEICSQIRMLKLSEKPNQPLSLIVIDHLHEMQEVADAENENKVLGRITLKLRKLADELKISILLLAQLNKSVATRSAKRPSKHDIHGAGKVIQSADAICLLYRDEYYNPDTPDRGIAEVIVDKNRSGKTGRVKLGFQSEFTRFFNLAKW